jgi:hypothetical protein
MTWSFVVLLFSVVGVLHLGAMYYKVWKRH